MTAVSRREFLRRSAGFAAAFSTLSLPVACESQRYVRVNGHLWIYASRFPPDWDSTPVLDEVFQDFQYAGIEGLEMMEVNLRREEAVDRIGALSEQYDIPVTGISYYGDMWDRSQHSHIMEDVDAVTDRLQRLGGSNIGITVGDAGRKKTEDELDAQADLLKRFLKICDDRKLLANLHNHTFEVADDLYDLKGTIERVPDLRLGPDVNWLIRGGVDPVDFIRTYGGKMVYLHLRDQDADGLWTEAVGEGVTDFPAIARALDETGFSGEVAIELASDRPPQKPMRDNWKASRDYVRNVFGW